MVACTPILAILGNVIGGNRHQSICEQAGYVLSDETHPLYNDNRLKLGIFCLNVSGGASATLAEGHWEATWPNVVEVATAADRGRF